MVKGPRGKGAMPGGGGPGVGMMGSGEGAGGTEAETGAESSQALRQIS